MKTILFVTELQPYPPYGGELIHCHNIIDSLSRHYQVVVLAPQPNQSCDLVDQVRAWHPLPSYSHALSAKWRNFYYRLKPRLIWAQHLDQLCRRYQPEIVWFNYGHWGQYVAGLKQYKLCTIMRVHNIQSSLAEQKYQTMSPGWRKVVQRLRYLIERRHEHSLFPSFDYILSVNETDRQYHAQFVGEQRSLMVPNYIRENNYQSSKPIERSEHLIVMTGNFLAFQNQQAVKWFLKNVWSQVQLQIPQLCLQLVGRGADRLVNHLPGHKRITGIGEVTSVTPYLRQAAIAVVPLLHGSGTRFKILEAWACAAPLVSTTLGAQGLAFVSGENGLLADSPVTFTQALIDLLRNPAQRTSFAQNGLSTLRSNYSFETNTQRIQEVVESMKVK